MGQQGDLAYDAEMVPWTVMSCRETGFHQPQIVLEVLRVSQELYSEDISHSQPGHLLGDRGLLALESEARSDRKHNGERIQCSQTSESSETQMAHFSRSSESPP